MGSLKSIAEALHGLLGWKTHRKLIVIASDDWGSVRVESNDSRNTLIAAGFNMDSNRFNKFDSIESNEDLEQLFATLRKFNDRKGNHPVVTALTNVANPDFDAIKDSGFSQYVYEPFVKTLQRYEGRDKVYELYKSGIAEGIFVPEFHGREHVNVNRWMKALQNNDPDARLAFDNRFHFIDSSVIASNTAQNLDAAFDIQNYDEIESQKAILRDGLTLFEKLFGYKSIFFTAPSMIFSPQLEGALYESGVRLLDVPKLRNIPKGNFRNKKEITFMGKKNKLGQMYVNRNCVFEPNMTPESDGVDECIKQIVAAFALRKPAIISNHRAAFVGGLNPENRTHGLQALDSLLGKILQQWPDAEFVSMRELQKISSDGV